jgi:hypothetical protein
LAAGPPDCSRSRRHNRRRYPPSPMASDAAGSITSLKFFRGNSPAAAGKLPNDHETSAAWPLSIGYTLKPGCVANALLRILLAICRPSVFSADVVRAPSTPYHAVNPASYVQAPW